MPTGGSGGAFATLTHARLRAGQGDVAGAVRILRVILAAQPNHTEARAFLGELDGRVAITYRNPVGMDGKARHRARAAHLSQWLDQIRRNRGERRVR